MLLYQETTARGMGEKPGPSPEVDSSVNYCPSGSNQS
ncbi:hypothetical protein C8D90_104236 [Enterobacillus tribolii]|uniref:Uncharacterized protein n=1 Tax=Enterobacillus tribolii TaxID=1487935 RepID=A0A370QS48_9GAMM|nr:hypothetical protein C8D90_104236 [Enterobacillus tribolii]